ncbi:MAG: recombinase family protein [Rhizobiales bacterium]|nr:recombinase family protein [Hyphomicrobiales bacterium]
MIKVAIYARYSSSLQKEQSIDDQLRICHARAKAEGWTVTKTYSDKEITGSTMLRPSLQDLLMDASERKFDIILSESLDRISRDQEGIAHIYKRMNHNEIKMITLAEGEINELHIGLKGTMSALYLKDLAQKTHRGLEGRALKGKCAGGKTYGYDVVRQYDSNGEPIRGDRKINEDEIRVVKCIFIDYAKGKSPKKIAHELNAEGFEGPTGNGWGQSTINGNRRRGTGILNNELYIGRQIWNRLRYLKNPDTGKRESRLNPESEWIITDVPDLRTIDQDMWDGVKARQKELDKKPTYWAKKRAPKLFSFLLKCSECGGGFGKGSAKHYTCSTARNKGTCKNRLTIHEDLLESTILNALSTQLMDPKLCEIFCREYLAHTNKLRINHNTSRIQYQKEFDRATKSLDKLIESIMNGIDSNLIKDKINTLEARRTQLQDLLNTTEEAPILIHPNMAKYYHQQITDLMRSLNNPDHRDESALILRKLISKIVLTPNKAKTKLQIDLHGDLAGILHFAREDHSNQKHSVQTERKLITELSEAEHIVSTYTNEGFDKAQPCKTELVAGARFELATFRL